MTMADAVDVGNAQSRREFHNCSTVEKDGEGDERRHAARCVRTQKASEKLANNSFKIIRKKSSKKDTSMPSKRLFFFSVFLFSLGEIIHALTRSLLLFFLRVRQGLFFLNELSDYPTNRSVEP